MTTESSNRNRTKRYSTTYIIAWTTAALTVVLIVGGLGLARERILKTQIAQLQTTLIQGPRVLIQPVAAPARSAKLQIPATVRGYVEAPVYAKVAGYLREIHVDKGDRVLKGQLLAVIESPETDQEVANARANYRLALVTDQRYSALLRSGVIARQAYDNQHAVMQADLATLQQDLALQHYEAVTAPFSGMITARYVDPGALIPQVTTAVTNATPIVTIATLQPVRVYANVPQGDAQAVHDGDPATVTPADYPGRQFVGTVTRHPDALDPSSRTMLVEVDLPNWDSALYPGMYATLDLKITAPQAKPAVPDDALVFRNNRVYVPVVRNDRLHLAPVTLGNDNGYTVEIASGLDAGDQVAIDVDQSAQDGELVQPVPVPK
jgi:membrane fusion protein, multidrug efflux system